MQREFVLIYPGLEEHRVIRLRLCRVGAITERTDQLAAFALRAFVAFHLSLEIW